MTIKTLHLTNSWHAESGGIATFYREMLKAADRLGRPIRLVVPSEADRVEEFGRYGRIFHVAGRPSRLSPGYRLIMPTRYLLPGSALRRIIADERPDLVECCDRYTLNYLAALLRRGWFISGYRPTVVGLVCERMDENVAHYLTASPLAKAFCRLYLKWLHFPMFDHHIANSAYTADELHEASCGHKVRRGVWVMPMGAACSIFRPERRSPAAANWIRNLCAAPEDCRLLLYVGRLVPEKNLEFLVQIMERLQREAPGAFHLLVAGDGSLRAHLETECSRRVPGAVWFLGHVWEHETLADIYANCDIFVHPNPGEPFGIAPLEAMASGLPLVAPNSGGLTSYANRDNAWLADPNPAAFTRVLYGICNDPAGAEVRARAARATAERFDRERVATGFFELYDELHSLVQGTRKEPISAPAFYSTAGNQFGWKR
jgi:glycosyltransferase involved in cell wall biosynthesis